MFTADLLERAVKTWVQTFLTVFLGALVVPAQVFSVGAWKAAALGALAGAVSAAFSAVMSVLSKPVGNKSSASLVAVPALDVASTVVATSPVTSAPAALDTSALVTLEQQGIDPALGAGGGYPKNTNASGS